MSAQQLIDLAQPPSGKIYNTYLPNPYPFPAQPPTLAQVLLTGNDAGNNDIVNVENFKAVSIGANLIQQPYLEVGVSGDDLRILGATAKGSILVGDGTNTEELICPTTTGTATTSTIFNWNALANGQSRTFSVSNGSLYQLGYSITITYSGTDSITGTITAIAGNLVTLTITSFASATYTPATLISTTPPDPTTATSGAGDPVFIFNPAVSTPASIPANSFLTTGLCYLYSAPAQPPLNITITALSIGAVNPTTSAFTIPVYELPPVSTTAFSWGAEGCFLPLGSPELASNTGGNIIAFAFPTGGSFVAQNFTGSVSGYTLPYTPNGVISINSKLVLTADSTKPLGVFWGVDATGVGAVSSVSAGSNISVSGSLSAPVVNLASPLTSTLAMGSVALTDKVGSSGTAGQLLSAGLGGETEWITPVSVGSVSSGTNIFVDNTNPFIPVVNFATPTTADILIGTTQKIIAKDNYATPNYTMSIDATGLNDTYLAGGVENKEDIAITATSVQDTIQTTNTTDYLNSQVITCDTNYINDARTSQIFTAGFEKTATMTLGCNTSGSLPISGIGCAVSAPTTTPFPDITASIGMTTDTTSPMFSLTQQAPFATSYSTTIDRDGINQNNSAGNGFSIQSAQNISLTAPSANVINITNGNNIEFLDPTATGYTTTISKQGVDTNYFVAGSVSSNADLTNNAGNAELLLSASNLATPNAHLLRLEVPQSGNALIEQIRDSYKGHIGTSLGKASITCDCGKKVSFTTLRFHLCGKKHRRLCGDLPEPPKEEDTEPKTPKPPSSP